MEISKALMQKDADMQPGDLIRALEGVQQKGYKNVAESLGMNYRTVLRIANGEVRPHWNTVIEILSAYGWGVQFVPLQKDSTGVHSGSTTGIVINGN